jgi:hypothetical protein
MTVDLKFPGYEFETISRRVVGIDFFPIPSDFAAPPDRVRGFHAPSAACRPSATLGNFPKPLVGTTRRSFRRVTSKRTSCAGCSGSWTVSSIPAPNDPAADSQNGKPVESGISVSGRRIGAGECDLQSARAFPGKMNASFTPDALCRWRISSIPGLIKECRRRNS